MLPCGLILICMVKNAMQMISGLHKLDLIFVSILLRLRLISSLCNECCGFETSLPLELVGDLLGEG